MKDDKRPVLKETAGAVVTPNPVLSEVAVHSGKRLRVRGVYQKEDAKNENNRSYPKEVWNINFADDSSLMERLKRRAVLGELEHPESGTTHLGRASHLIEELWRETLEEDNEYGVTPGDYILGQHLVLNTPSGKILRELYECKIPVGVSSRGRGDVEPDAEGVDVVQDNYEAETWDCVYQPSVVEASPEPVKEGKEAKPAKTNLLEEGRSLLKTVNKVISRRPTAGIAELVELGSKVDITLQQLTENKSEEYNKEDTRAIGGLLKGCLTQLTEAVEKQEHPAVKDDEPVEEPIAPRSAPRREPVSINEKHAELLARFAERTARAEAVAKRIQSAGSAGRFRRDEKAVSRKRYDTLVELADGLLTRGRNIKVQLNETEKKLEAAVTLSEGLAKRLKGNQAQDQIHGYIETAVKEHPELEGSKQLLLECKSVKEAADKVKLLKTAVLAGQRGEVPAENQPEKVEAIHRPAGGDAVTTPVREKQKDLSSLMFERKGL